MGLLRRGKGRGNGLDNQAERHGRKKKEIHARKEKETAQKKKKKGEEGEEGGSNVKKMSRELTLARCMARAPSRRYLEKEENLETKRGTAGGTVKKFSKIRTTNTKTTKKKKKKNENKGSFRRRIRTRLIALVRYLYEKSGLGSAIPEAKGDGRGLYER